MMRGILGGGWGCWTDVGSAVDDKEYLESPPQVPLEDGMNRTYCQAGSGSVNILY